MAASAPDRGAYWQGGWYFWGLDPEPWGPWRDEADMAEARALYQSLWVEGVHAVDQLARFALLMARGSGVALASLHGPEANTQAPRAGAVSLGKS